MNTDEDKSESKKVVSCEERIDSLFDEIFSRFHNMDCMMSKLNLLIKPISETEK